MKYVLAVIGFVIGRMLGDLLTETRALQWAASALFGVVGYWLGAFLRYARSTPRQLLAFHGPDSPITRTRSENELRTFLAQLHSGGLLDLFDPASTEAVVDADQWAGLAQRERLTLCQAIMQACELRLGPVPDIHLRNTQGQVLATYSRCGGLVTG